MTEGNTNIEILKPVFFDKVIGMFEGCLFCVLPSRSEAMGRVLIEAMAAGKPVIGSRVGGIPGVITDGYDGFLFESENIDALADKMIILLSNEELRKRMGKNALSSVKNKFSSEKYAECFQDNIKSQQCVYRKAKSAISSKCC